MLPKSQRLSTELFKDVIVKGTLSPGAYSMFRVLKDEHNAGTQSRFAVSVSKKVANTAVLRNSLRRKGYRALQSLMNQLKPGYLGIFLLKATVSKASNEELQGDMKNMVAKQGILQ